MSSELNNPPVLLKPFADSGDKNIIPELATGTQRASLDEGFPPITSTPLSQGGIPPERADFNGLGNMLSTQYFYLQNGGRFTFNQEVSDAIGGYSQGATLWYKDDNLGISYPVTSLINNNTYNFVTTPSYIDGVKWKRVIDSFPSTQVTNCITEIPQDIKLELNNGTLTLKAGSKVYVPNGSGVFDEKTISSDISMTGITYNTTYLLFTSANATSLFAEYRSSCSSGTTQPSGTWKTWYDTTNNKIKRFGSTEGTVLYEGSLPIAVITVSGGVISSIDQVFNGFGYIGNTIFALPGVKGLIPNERNVDGTLKNTETASNGVLTYTNPDTATGNYYIQFRGNYIARANANPSSWRYDEERNIILWNNTQKQNVLFAGNLVLSLGRVESLTPKTTFHAVDYSDFNNLTINILKTVYPVGAVYIGTTSTCPLEALFGTWTLKSSGRVLQGADSNHSAGTTIEAGLPNITGTINKLGSATSTGLSVTGAFKLGTLSHSNIAEGGGWANTASTPFSFDASESNSIYGNSTTVQPPAYVVNIWERTA